MPQARPVQVFLSSASGELAQHRETAVAACHRIGLVPEYMEDFRPDRQPPLEVCERRVAESDIFVLLLADRYGSRPEGDVRSYTELEYEFALTDPDMPLLIFTVDPAGDPPPERPQRRLIERVRAAHTVYPLNSPDRFREDLILALLESVEAQDKSAALPAADRVPFIEHPPTLYANPPYVGGAPFTGRADDLAEIAAWRRSTDPLMVVEAIGGTGKSALAWQWTSEQDSAGFAGRFWWSFYETSASLQRFLQELWAYTTGQSIVEAGARDRDDLLHEVTSKLREKPFLIVMDGFERLLSAYHRFDRARMPEDEIEPTKRTMIEANGDETLRRLTAVNPSKILICTRLMPRALGTQFGKRLPGVRHVRLPGLSDADTDALLHRLGVSGREGSFPAFFGPLGNHPLLIGIVAGLVRDYRPGPGDFDLWLSDADAGGALNVAELELTHRRTHILAAALRDLPGRHRSVLEHLSTFDNAVDWETVVAMEARMATFGPAARGAPHTRARSTALLAAALSDLEDRGLLWWERASNTYDMHPIVRAYTHGQTRPDVLVQTNDVVVDHFQALPPEDTAKATSVEDVRQTITIYRALVGAENAPAASRLWSGRLSRPLLIELGASATAIELLTPLAAHGSVSARTDLVVAYQDLGGYDEAILEETATLGDALAEYALPTVVASLSRLSSLHGSAGAEILAELCLEFCQDLRAALGWSADANLYLKQAARAAGQGDAARARMLLGLAERLPQNFENPWIGPEIFRLRTFLDAKEGAPVDLAAIAAERQRRIPWASRHSLAVLQFEVAVRDGRFDEALRVARGDREAGVQAGVEAVPAASALALARLDRHAEARVALDESLARFPTLHPAAAPTTLVAETLLVLGLRAEASTHALNAYRQAWRDGPPHCRHWRLLDAQRLLDVLGLDAPTLPWVTANDVEMPYAAMIDQLIGAARRGEVVEPEPVQLRRRGPARAERYSSAPQSPPALPGDGRSDPTGCGWRGWSSRSPRSSPSASSSGSSSTSTGRTRRRRSCETG